jgi:hypothetical protein
MSRTSSRVSTPCSSPRSTTKVFHEQFTELKPSSVSSQRIVVKCKPTKKPITDIRFMNEKQVISAGRTYNFDKVYNTETKNHNIYEDIIHPNLTHFVNGINLTVMAYGQTASGKTYTMLNQGPNDTGIVYESLSTLFGLLELVQNHSLFISCFEIYNEHVYDMISNTGKVLQLRYKDKDVYVSNLVWKQVKTTSEASKYIDSAIKHRSSAKTNMNERSSRSHFLVCFKLHQYYDIVGEETQSLLYFVDLAGSEKHQPDSNLVREASYINRCDTISTNSMTYYLGKC